METKNRETATHVVAPVNKSFFLAFVTPYKEDHYINEHLKKHGDGVYDIAF